MLRSYQSVIILKPDLDGPQLDQAIEKFELIFKKSGGAVINLEKWGKKRLAYKIRKHKFGIYLNIYHTCEAAKTSEMEKEYQLYDLVIKYLIIKLDEKAVERIISEKEAVAEEEAAREKASADDNAASDKPDTVAAAAKPGADEENKG